MYFFPEVSKQLLPVSGLKLRDMTDDVRKQMEAHDCTITEHETHYDVELPQGCTRQEMLPRMLDMRYYLNFPDGWRLKEVHNRIADRSTLFYIE
jgi:hypothetical protein